MFLRFENLAILFGLFAVGVPIVLHLLQRRRFDVLDWGAMQFLPDSIVTQRRRWLDEIVLLLLRMGLIALIVLALATPISTSAWLGAWAERSARDVVLVFDGSYSMDARHPNQPTPWDDAIQQALAQIGEAEAGTRFAIVIARQPPLIWRGEFTAGAAVDLKSMPAPRGNAGMPGGLAAAWKLLQRSDAPVQEIRVFTDRQRHGWADTAALAALDTLGNEWRADIERAKREGGTIPALRVVTVGNDLPQTPNHVLTPLQIARGVAKVGQPVTVQNTLRLGNATRAKVQAMLDGKVIEELSPGKLDDKQGLVPLKFVHTFPQEGQHVVSFALDAHDVLRADNEQHAIVDVVKELPMLFVDGDRQLGPESSTFFLEQALASPNAKNAPAVPFTNVKPDDFAKPAVVVLADVPRLDAEQLAALDRFVANGGGLLVALGERAAQAHAFYNLQPWMPAKLVGVGIAKNGVHPDPRAFQHAALALLQDTNLAHIRFTQWTRVQLASDEGAAGILSNEAPLFVEKAYKRGRVMLMTVPPDRRWGSTFPSASEFPILMHELTQHLAGLHNGSSVLDKGEPIRISSKLAVPTQVTLKTPESEARTFEIKQWPWNFDNTGAIGVYQVRLADGQARSFVVRPELAEGDLTRCGDDDWRWVQARLPVAWQTEGTTGADIVQTPRVEVWWLFLVAVLGFLCLEVWLTRRLALARG